ncbi:MAG TPA: helix-turn-helix domain-containing protein [Pseudonocardia sp.]
MRNTSFAEMHCSLARALEVVGDWWTPLIVRDLYLGLDRFDLLVRDLGISRNLLTERLATLVEGGLVAKVAYQDRPVRHRYALTAAGSDLVPVLMALTAWGDRWTTPDGGPPMLVRHDDCGAMCVATVSCANCGKPLRADTTTVRPGPGGRSAPGTALIAQVLTGRTV